MSSNENQYKTNGKCQTSENAWAAWLYATQHLQKANMRSTKTQYKTNKNATRGKHMVLGDAAAKKYKNYEHEIQSILNVQISGFMKT